MKIIGLTGYARSGKDSVGAVLVARGWHRVSFADNIRALALAADPLIPGDRTGVDDFAPLSDYVAAEGWHAAKYRPEVRRFLQALGSGVRDVLGEETWVDAALVPLAAGTPAGVVVTDVRHQNEAAAIRARGGVVVRVVRPGVGPANDHVTEAGTDAIVADYTLGNDTTLAGLAGAVDDMLVGTGLVR